jgi:ketosteroid isomerase-like protein
MHEVVERYFVAMQQGPEGHDALIDLFADDAVYREPFSGQREHRGRREIRDYLMSSAGDAPPQLRIVVERIDLAGDTVAATWRCESPAFAGPARGRDTFTITHGKITRLETALLDPPLLRRPSQAAAGAAGSAGTRPATVEAYLEMLPAGLREVGEHARTAIDAGLPEATAAIRWAHPTWSIGSRPICYLKAASRHLTFGFWRGASIDDPSGRLQTSGQVMAHTKLRSVEDIDPALFGRWLAQAVSLERQPGR